MADDATQDDATQRAAPAKRKRRAAPVSTAARLQPKTLLASTRDELREIEASLQAVADARRALVAADARGAKSTIRLLPPKATSA